MLEEESPRFGVGVLTPRFIERLSTIPENEIFPIFRFSDVIGYLALWEDDLYLAVCPTFTKPRIDSTFSLFRLSISEFSDYCASITHTSKFGEVVFQFVHSRRISPLKAVIPSLQEALTLLMMEVQAPLQ
jgi:hypothetical protein